ncbi:hypothetical protein B0T18DRAFT_121693 [Schizothecium vesticola]|uniref:Ankyrin n=1 Tax=Schizothecium vesticola TaxID=314040 RepID=A0AA40K8L8_9PEZI|nr:hypothetical protein B0T18DRAFT_121693 [Schizothecium vesticola]
MLQQRVIHPEDRDADGNSLLHYVISSTYSADMCRLLLQHGADPSNCNLYGDHALAILLASLPQLVTDASKGLSESDKILIRLLLGVGHDEITSHSRYLKKGAPHLAPTGVFHCLLSRHNARHIDLPALLFNMIENKFDLEATDLHGNTPLLFALYYLPAPQLFPVARLLLRHGANSNARNNFGEDGLHMLLRRLSACDSSPASFVDDFVALLTTLLHAGADPTRGNQYGSTAIDKAMTPTCFPLFCRALLTAGRNPRSVVSLACDARIPPPLRLTASEIDAAHRRALASRFALLGYHIIPKSTESLRFVTDAAPCCLCGGRLDWNRQRAMPFDEFNSVVVDEFGFPIHMTWYMHCLGGTRCLQIYREDSSHALDYWVEEMNVEELRGRSLRRHVALRLWEEGYLDGEGARGRWEGDVAAGVGT